MKGTTLVSVFEKPSFALNLKHIHFHIVFIWIHCLFDTKFACDLGTKFKRLCLQQFRYHLKYRIGFDFSNLF